LDLRYLDQKLSSALAILSLNSLDIRDRVAGAYVHALAGLADEDPPHGSAAAWTVVFDPLALVPRPPAGGALSQSVIRAAVGQLPHPQLVRIEEAIRSLAKSVSAEVQGTAKTASRLETGGPAPGQAGESASRPPPFAAAARRSKA